MKKFLLFLVVVGCAVFAYFWYVRGVNLFKRTEDYPLPQYGAVNQPQPKGAGTTTAPVISYQWKSAAPMPTPRSNVGVASIGSHVYVIGGLGDLARPTDAVEMYDTKSNSWTTLHALPKAVRNPAVVMIDGKLYVFGGFEGLAGTPVSTVFIYDPGKDVWSRGADLPHATGGSGAVVVDGRAHLLGGASLDGVTDAHLVYDPKSDAWGTESTMNSARGAPAAVLVGRKIYVIGGQQGSLVYDTDIVESYDVDRKQWDSVVNMPRKRTALAAIADGDRIFVFGGEGPTATVAAIDVLDTKTENWTTLKETMPHARYGLGVAFDSGSFFLIGGGQRAGLSISELNEVMEPIVKSNGTTPKK